MKPRPSPAVERGRIIAGPKASSASYGNNGAFILSGPKGVKLFVIASDGGGWEHVSVSPVDLKRCPTWEEMCFVKDAFFEPEETVIQYHPAKSRYVNCHPYTLHIWRPMFEGAIPLPPLEFV
jgi:hypothetical protein